MKTTIKIKKDKYRRARGGSSKILAIYCNCGSFLWLYQKDGPGQLKRMYLDRIMGKDFEPLVASAKCEKCGKVIAIPMVYKKENRPALRVIRGMTTKKSIQKV